MTRRIGLLAAILLLPLSAAAASGSTIGSLSCSGSPAISLLDAASFACTGDLVLSGGTITSDLAVIIAADGSLSLDNISISAPSVQFTAWGGQLSIGDGVSISSDSFLGGVGPGVTPIVTVSPGATITVGRGAGELVIGSGDILRSINAPIVGGGDVTLAPPIPEPEFYGSMALGLLLVLRAVERRRRLRA